MRDQPGLEWDALKAYFRGRIIQHSTYLKKQAIERLLELKKEIKDLEKMHAPQLEPKALLHLSKLKLTLCSSLQKKAEFALFQRRQRYCEQGETAGRFLAQRAKQQYNQTLISSVENEKGDLVTDTGEINGAFRIFYQTLYTSQGATDQEDVDNFLSQTHLPSLSEEKQKEIRGDITLEEVQEAIKRLCSGKAPGGDGFPTDFYKVFSDITAPRLLIAFRDALKRGNMPESMQSVVMTLIHKKGKNPQ